MKAISIRGPWWYFILCGLPNFKNIENRKWPTTQRGNVLIHAAKGCSEIEFDAAVKFAAKARCFKVPNFDTMERGGIVGVVRIVDCVTRSTSPWFVGPYGFVLADPYPLPFRPCNGALGFFDPPEL
jgi:hypothetical protein